MTLFKRFLIIPIILTGATIIFATCTNVPTGDGAYLGPFYYLWAHSPFGQFQSQTVWQGQWWGISTGNCTDCQGWEQFTDNETLHLTTETWWNCVNTPMYAVVVTSGNQIANNDGTANWVQNENTSYPVNVFFGTPTDIVTRANCLWASSVSKLVGSC